VTMSEERDMSLALRRGFAARCPRCGEGHMFKGYLTVTAECDHCNEPLGAYPAADGPAFFTMTIVMLLLIPLLAITWTVFRADPVTMLLVLGGFITVLTLVLLRLVKGAFVGYLWAKDERDRGA